MRASSLNSLLADNAVKGSDPIDVFKRAINPGRPWDSIVDFATHPTFCGLSLYPRQETLLKLIYLETENMTAYDLDVIGEWTQGFSDSSNPQGVQVDIWDRVEYLKANGYSHFPHIQAVQGRRASKGTIGGVLGAERMAYFVSLDDPQAEFGLAPGKTIWLSVVATNSLQAKKFQFADVRETVERCQWLHPYISTSNDYTTTLRTNADIRRIAEMKRSGLPVDREIASVRAIAMSSTSSSGRGGSGFMNIYDEFAHMLSGTAGPRTSEAVYDSYQPSLDQFGKDAMTYIPSSPYCLAPETRVLKEDLTWVPVGELELGDTLIGFDEYPPPGRGQSRTFQPTKVVDTSIINVPRYKMTMESGKEIISTDEHLWLTRRVDGGGRGKGRGQRSQSYPQNWCWIPVKDLRPGDKIKTLGVEPWEVDTSHEVGYLAGLYDGEGFLSDSVVGFAQNPGVVQDRALEVLDSLGFEYSQGSSEDYTNCIDTWLTGGRAEMMRFLGTVRPLRLLEKFYKTFYGSRIYGGRKTHKQEQFDRVVSIEYLDEGPVVALETSTKTLIAEGLFSHNTKVGRFYELYQTGTVTVPEYDHRTDSVSLKTYTDQDEEVQAELEAYTETLEADPEFLIIQLPSWGLYRDYERAEELVGRTIKRAIQYQPDPAGQPENVRMARLEKRDPVKFKVERRAQFAEVVGAYLDPKKVDNIFEPEENQDLSPKTSGVMNRSYQAHVDAGATDANFAYAIAHLEKSPVPDEHGIYWDHVVFDKLQVFRPQDYEDNIVDYVGVEKQIERELTQFRTLKEWTFDQWNSIGFIARLSQFAKKKKLPVRVHEVNFNDTRNTEVAKKFRSAINLGWVKAYKDDYFEGMEGSNSLLENELKFLVEKNGKVQKQSIGPVTTKDLADCVMEVSVRLLSEQLDNWQSRLLGTTQPATGLSGGYPRTHRSEGPTGFQSNNSSPFSDLRSGSTRGTTGLDRLRGRRM